MINYSLIKTILLITKDEHIEKEKLQMIIFLCDVLSYIENNYRGNTVTCEDYFKMPRVPTQENFDMALNLLSAENLLIERCYQHGLNYYYEYTSSDNVNYESNKFKNMSNVDSQCVQKSLNLIQLDKSYLSKEIHNFLIWKNEKYWGDKIDFTLIKHDNNLFDFLVKNKLLS